MTFTLVAKAAASLALAIGTAAGPAQDSLRLFYVGHDIGAEHYAIARTAQGWVATADFDYMDRGRRTHVVDTVRLAADYAPLSLDVRRLSDSGSTNIARVTVQGSSAHVELPTGTQDVTLPATAFVIAGDLPTSQHLLLLRYWLSHGRPAKLAVVPGGPTNPVTIRELGRTTLTVHGRAERFTRYAVDGVVWGIESVWLDDAGNLALVTSGGGGGLTLEAVRADLAPQYARIMHVVIGDRMADLAAMSQRVHAVASGDVALVGATLIDGTGAAPVPDATVLVHDGKIVAAGPSASVTVPARARRMDVRGKTIIPGLWNTHVHLHQVEWLPVYMAAGETTVRDMGNEIDFELAMRKAVQQGTVIGPNLVLAGLVDGGGPNAFGAVTADTPDEGRAVV
ncbi:MAG TPA: hypothetical protein VG818_08225, partial [Gemmatimonadaceae bacterium]|nr:hypothetical protein [Gemmatimonadaceae bacterium]